ncbi:hypothetical protein DVH24_018344 [Malus domestica]|uniref:Uncharacterized protein n=1 Tax=Malus domestica TaxID=3750 RepID=A0A498KKZ2_MALDO|nr:hypothetical protein DVH24_018344 [Malus domestica]
MCGSYREEKNCFGGGSGEALSFTKASERGTKKIKGIVVKWPKPDVIPLNSKSFFEMVNLEIFISRNAHFSGCVDYLPNYLRWIDLGGDKFRIWGSNILQKHTVTFNLQYLPRHLVTYNMSYSDIRQLKGFKVRIHF